MPEKVVRINHVEIVGGHSVEMDGNTAIVQDADGNEIVKVGSVYIIEVVNADA